MKTITPPTFLDPYVEILTETGSITLFIVVVLLMWRVVNAMTR